MNVDVFFDKIFIESQKELWSDCETVTTCDICDWSIECQRQETHDVAESFRWVQELIPSFYIYKSASICPGHLNIF